MLKRWKVNCGVQFSFKNQWSTSTMRYNAYFRQLDVEYLVIIILNSVSSWRFGWILNELLQNFTRGLMNSRLESLIIALGKAESWRCGWLPFLRATAVTKATLAKSRFENTCSWGSLRCGSNPNSVNEYNS